MATKWEKEQRRFAVQCAADNLVTAEHQTVEIGAIHKAYEVQCVLDGRRALPASALSRWLRAAGYRLGKHSRTRRAELQGYRLKG